MTRESVRATMGRNVDLRSALRSIRPRLGTQSPPLERSTPPTRRCSRRACRSASLRRSQRHARRSRAAPGSLCVILKGERIRQSGTLALRAFNHRGAAAWILVLSEEKDFRMF